MQLLRSLLFNLFFYGGIIFVFIIALPTLLLPPQFALYFGKFLGHYVIFIVKILLGTKIRINNISPGGIFDNQNKQFVKRYSKFTNYNSMLNVDDVIGVIDFLISSKNKKITGQNISIDDGFTL